MDDITLLSCRKSTIKDQKLTGDKFYIAQKLNNNAHGKTIKEAIKELAFKCGPRNVEIYRNMPFDTAHTLEDWKYIYRTITGACKFGTDRFTQDKGSLHKFYTLQQIIVMTEGQWGHETFVNTVDSHQSKR